MLPLLDYSTKKAHMLQEYHGQLAPQLTYGEPWEDAHRWVMLTGEVEILIRDTVQLYRDIVRADEFHHLYATTLSEYPYAQMEERLEALFRQMRDLLEQAIDSVAQMERHGYPPQGQADLTQCLHAVDVLLADESPIYPTEAFQHVLKQSVDDIKAGRVVEMPQEQG